MKSFFVRLAEDRYDSALAEFDEECVDLMAQLGMNREGYRSAFGAAKSLLADVTGGMEGRTVVDLAAAAIALDSHLIISLERMKP